jgi:ATP-dependent Lhr-like helicase
VSAAPADSQGAFHPVVAEWFRSTFPEPTPAQAQAWPHVLAGRTTLLLAPTGSGKTLAAFLAAIDRLLFRPPPPAAERCRVLYISPLKALAADVERNLRAPLAGIRELAERRRVACHAPAVAVRTGDTPAADRARLARAPADILITTPESLFLLLTSNARETLRHVETVIVDEIHALAGTKRGVHLSLSLERLEALRHGAAPLQRLGLSATQRPLAEVARLLGGGTVAGPPDGPWTPRPVEIVDAGRRKVLELTVEVPVDDLARLSEAGGEGAQASGAAAESLWPSIYPRLVNLVRAHRSTLIFANSRRLAERLAGALNETAGEEISQAHHGSVSKEKRAEIEERLKAGALRSIVATSSLELGIDMGAVDLVVQIEAPPSVASGMQRIGRAGHQVGVPSRGILFPKYRGDLLACAAAAARMMEGEVEETHYPRNCLDVLAQQVVAAVALDDQSEAELWRLCRQAAPYADLPRASWEGVLDMLSGRYPSAEFAELRPRLTWDRLSGTLRARAGARRLVVVNAGTIPDRGLYGVFLAADDARRSRRVGELDEEMVFESQPGEVFILGASSWRIEEITHDRVLVSPAPGEPGRMPFWRGDRAGRPRELGEAIGALARELVGMSPEAAQARLVGRHGLEARAAQNLVAYLGEQRDATGDVPSDQALVLERYLDEVGDWRVCVLSPYGARVHAPWATAVLARLARETDAQVEMLWSDDGMVFRLPESEAPPPAEWFLPRPDEVQDLVTETLPRTSLFAARFRENAARALLLPRRAPGRRNPLWAQRKRSADLLAVAARHPVFPILLETYRECLQEAFDLPGLTEVLSRVHGGSIRRVVVDSTRPSPFAASLLFSYVANFIYDLDAPLAERRAQALSVDPAQLRELLGAEELRELIDAGAVAEVERRLQRLDARSPARTADGVHDLLLSLGDLTAEEIAARSASPELVPGWLDALERERRIFRTHLGGEVRFFAAEDAARVRDALGRAVPPGLPAALLQPVSDPLGDLVGRYARTHGPFPAEAAAARLGIDAARVREALGRLAAAGRVIEGELLPGGHGREHCDRDVLRQVKRRSLAKLRREVEPVEAAALARLFAEWQGVTRPRGGAEALVAVVEQIQGCALPASALESEILPARVLRYRPADLDALMSAGEVVWRGLGALGPSDGRIALFLRDQEPLLAPPVLPVPGDLPARLRDLLQSRGALFFSDLAALTGAFPGDLAAALWEMVWAGEVTNDTLAPLRSLARAGGARRERRPSGPPAALRRHRPFPPGTEGRWGCLAPSLRAGPTETERRTALARALLGRYGVLTREAVHAEEVPGGFSAVYPVLKAMEEAGRARRGYFVAGLGAAQFALPGADDRLRALRDRPEAPATYVLAATDPANPYGAALPWPESPGGRPQRVPGAQVVIRDGELCAYARGAERSVLTFFPAEDPERQKAAAAVAEALAGLVEGGRRRALLVSRVDGGDPAQSPLGPALAARGFTPGSRGYLKRAPLAVRLRER